MRQNGIGKADKVLVNRIKGVVQMRKPYLHEVECRPKR